MSSPFSVFVSLVPESIGLEITEGMEGARRSVVVWARIKPDGSDDARRLAEWRWEVWIHAGRPEAGPVGDLQYRPFAAISEGSFNPEGCLVTAHVGTGSFAVMQDAAIAGRVPAEMVLQLSGVEYRGADGQPWRLEKPAPLGSLRTRWGRLGPED